MVLGLFIWKHILYNFFLFIFDVFCSNLGVSTNGLDSWDPPMKWIVTEGHP